MENKQILGKPTKIDERRRITIPAEVMNLLDLREGDYIVFTRNDGSIVIRKAKLVIQQAAIA